jgi:hypothetical protein
MNHMARCEARVAEALANAEAYHEAYYNAGTFGGPGLHLHRRCMEFVGQTLSVPQLECIYATLATWGMHRMGPGGSKMLAFEHFEASVMTLRDHLTRARHFDHRYMDKADWDVLRQVFLGVRVMASSSTLVGNSKVMAHLLPNLVPPIDREYTLMYLRGNKNVPNGAEREWLVMRQLLAGFFFPVAADTGFRARAGSWMANTSKYLWDTSLMKAIDNVVIGAMKTRKDGSIALGGMAGVAKAEVKPPSFAIAQPRTSGAPGQ